MIQINNKFNINEECWTVYRKPVKFSCYVCNGSGKIEYSGYVVKCPLCNATGMVTNHTKQFLSPCSVTIKRIDVYVSNYETSPIIKYRVKPLSYDVNVKRRKEDVLFKTEQEAFDYCKKCNTGEILNDF